jgi:DNA-binding winged helix-turn-helix (wHTH) protein
MPASYAFGPFRLETDSRILFCGTEPTMLGQRAVALLQLPLQQAGTPVGKDALMAAAWPGLAVEDSNLTVQIAALRRLFEARAGGDGWIETLPRRGYRYVGPRSRRSSAPGRRRPPLSSCPTSRRLRCCRSRT